ncbi:hypothetical protein A2454_04085 [Candidatus Peribacteria bacterium RIFOXYC2_FULL_55_14]|nr:MAG: hypothetical protein UY85_C0057G0005 [Candidatus Peribacteria bacterium GW2011_GWB1_54_5]KKW39864.1 MAG: hypothetical protein UY87_C0033G0004 [Candidatus Peribacteria bacterium GW2011_GWC2_54_8]KKW39934.1 MAG: hypothetical protein UY90_C0092G0005 [Candidatus Peregrinibacteria bacterium GW2011_GWA2_54_9]OGJ72232.1 MAG: hypothetical protein A2198_02285 [Candidatus Peribacteria bacterium RIFOXYA1_FULL_56_14]OGJ73601.1 MAG: hypothetical protein A2217_03865 [Candidatus Peribacteria bacterium
MSIEVTPEPAQKPLVSYRSPEWANLRTGVRGDETAVARAPRHLTETAGGNGQSVERAEKGETPVEAAKINHTSLALQAIRTLIVARMHSLRPGPRPSFREGDRHGELKRILALAEIGASPGELVFALRNSRHKGTRNFGKQLSVTDGDGSVTLQPDYATEAEIAQEMIRRTDALLGLLDPDDEPEFAPADTPADRAYAQADDHLFDPPPETHDGETSVKVA